jgi:hypothetical protein
MGMDNCVVVFLPAVPGDTTVILMLGGTQAAANSVMFRNVPGAWDGVWGIAADKPAGAKTDMARISPNMVDNESCSILMI